MRNVFLLIMLPCLSTAFFRGQYRGNGMKRVDKQKYKPRPKPTMMKKQPTLWGPNKRKRRPRKRRDRKPRKRMNRKRYGGKKGGMGGKKGKRERQKRPKPKDSPDSVEETQSPTPSPSMGETELPTSSLSPTLSRSPTNLPTAPPSAEPTILMSPEPSPQPSVEPSAQPSELITGESSAAPSAQPSEQPSAQPVGADASTAPSPQPSQQPSAQPVGADASAAPSPQPSEEPSAQPVGADASTAPSPQASEQPSAQPVGADASAAPSMQPSEQPSAQPVGADTSAAPSLSPSQQPSAPPVGADASAAPSLGPSIQPSSEPSTNGGQALRCTAPDMEQPLPCVPTSGTCSSDATALQAAIDAASAADSLATADVIAICQDSTITTLTPLTVTVNPITLCCEGGGCIVDSAGTDRNLIISNVDAIVSDIEFRGGTFTDPDGTGEPGGGNVLVEDGARDIGFLNCIFDSGSSATGGGNVFVGGALTLTIRSSHFTNGDAGEGYGGGGILIYSTTDFTIENSYFAGNKAVPPTLGDGGVGGAIAFFGPFDPQDAVANTFFSVQGSCFADNEAEDGGAIYSLTSFIDTLQFSLEDNIFDFNSARNQGGILSVFGEETPTNQFTLLGNVGSGNIAQGEIPDDLFSPVCNDLLFEIFTLTGGLSSDCYEPSTDVTF